MAASVNQVLAQMQRWTAAARTVDVADAVLLRRYTQQRDQAAFAALVTRHGPLVLRLCRRILGDAHAAEDAFRAVFLILSRKAHLLKQPHALPAWLHGVARRVALKARGQANGRNSIATCVDEALLDPHPDPLTQLTARELLDILDDEVGRLRRAQRSAVILCCLEGRSRDEAARILGWTQGAVKGQLQRGRQRLQDRLGRRGIALSAALALEAVSRGEATSALLLRSTVTAALGGGIGTSAAALAHRVLKTMLLGKLAGMTALVLTLALAASSTVALVHRGPTGKVPNDETPPVSAVTKADTDQPQARRDALGDPLPDGAIARLGSQRFRHADNIAMLTFTPDGKRLVSQGNDGVRVWDAATGRELRHLPRKAGTLWGHSDLSPDGKWVAVSGHVPAGPLEFWEVEWQDRCPNRSHPDDSRARWGDGAGETAFPSARVDYGSSILTQCPLAGWLVWTPQGSCLGDCNQCQERRIRATAGPPAGERSPRLGGRSASLSCCLIPGRPTLRYGHAGTRDDVEREAGELADRQGFDHRAGCSAHP